uniref:Uncharacterized protein n=1 Tax=Myoviridae sp. ct3Pt8 TaxID=2826608 RepID=A0A8S5MM32_9CAUD|nr:MAG TPA: hypothetical protein [Myoviridae sp. ct3Pt8]
MGSSKNLTKAHLTLVEAYGSGGCENFLVPASERYSPGPKELV